MQTRLSIKTSVFVFFTFLAGMTVSRGATLLWDADTTSNGPQDGSGTWNTSLNNWWTGSANATFNNATPDAPIFGATNGAAGTVTLGSQIVSGAIIFNAPAVGTYTIAGGGNTLALTNRTITANVDATISADIAGTGGFTLANSAASAPSGVLTLSGGASTISGTFNLGTSVGNTTAILRITTNNAFGASTNPITIAGGQGNFTSQRIELAGNNIMVSNSIPSQLGRNTHAPVIVNLGTGNTWGGKLTRSTGGADVSIESEVANGITFSGVSSNGFALGSEAGAPRNYVLRGTGGGTVSGIITNGSAANNTSIVKAGSGTWTFSGANTFTNATLVNEGALVLDYSTQNNNKIAPQGPLTLAGGTLTLNGGSFTQAANSTTVGTGASAVTRTSGTSVLRLNAITRSRAGVIDFGAASIADTDTLNVNGILGNGCATIAGSDWAINSTGAADGPITAYTGYTDIDALGSSIADNAASNVRLNSAAGAGNITLAAVTTTVNTLLQNTTTAATIDTSIGTLRFGTNGALLVPAGKQGVTFGTAVNSGIVTAGAALNTAGEIIVINNSANDVLVNSVITNNGTGVVSLTKAGSGTLTLTGTNGHGGTNTIVAGTLNVSSDINLGAVPGAATVGKIQISGGVLNAADTFTLNANRGILVGPNSRYGNGTIGVAGTKVLTYGGIIANGDSTGNGPGGSLTKIGNGTLILGGANTYTYGTYINGGTVSISTSGNLGASPSCYTSDHIVINGGTLQATATLTLGAPRGIMLGPIGSAGGGTFQVDPTFTLQLDSRIADNWNSTGSLTKTGNGTLLLTGAFNDYSGDTTISAGTLQISNARAIPNGPDKGNLNINATLDLNNTSPSLKGLLGNSSGIVDNTVAGSPTLTVGHNNATATFNGVIKNTAGTLSLTKTGSGVQTLSGANTYGGSTLINAGTLALTGSGSIAGTNINVAAGATFDVSAISFTLSGTQTLGGNGTVLGNVTDSSGSILSPGASVGLLNVNGNLTLAGGDTVKCEFGVNTNDQLAVSGNLTPSGTTTINLATLPPGGFTNGDYPLILVSGNLNGSPANFTISGAPSPTRQTFGITYDTGSSPKRVLLHVGGGVATLLWQGGLAGNAWDIVTTANWTNLTSSSSDFYFDSDVVSFTDYGSANSPVNVSTTVKPSSVTVDSANPYTLSGNGKISGSSSLTKNNSGALTVSTTNDYTGVTTLNGGTVSVAAVANGGSASPLGAAPSASANLVFGGGTLQFTGAAGSTDRGATLKAGGGSIDVASPNSLTVNGVVTGTNGGGLTKLNNGTLVLGGANTYDGNSTINGTVQVNAAGTFGNGAGSVTLNAGSALQLNGPTLPNAIVNNGAITNNTANNTILSGAISGSGPIVVTNTGNLTLSGNNSGYSGTIYVQPTASSKGLIIANNNALGTSPNVIVTTTTSGTPGGSRVAVSGGVSTPAGTTISLSSSSTPATRSELFSDGSGNNNVWNGPIVLSGDNIVAFDGNTANNDTWTIAGNISGPTFITPANTGGLQLRQVDGIITGTINLPSGNIQLTDARTWTIQPPAPGANTWLFTQISSGTLKVGNNNALPAASILNGSGGSGALDLNGFNQTLAGFTNGITALITNGSATADSTFTYSGAGAPPSAFGGNFSDGVRKLALTVSSGALTLSTANGYHGDTTVSGTLALTASATISNSATLNIGATGTLNASGRTDGALALSSGQTLKGNGTVVGTLSLSTGSTIAPGASVGALTNTGSALLLTDATNVVEVSDAGGAAGTGYDTTVVSGNIGVLSTSANPFHVKLVSLNAVFDTNSSYAMTIMSGTVTNFATNKFVTDETGFTNNLAGGHFFVTTNNTGLIVSFNHAPVATNVTYLRNIGTPLKVLIANLATNWGDLDGNSVTFSSVSPASANSFAVSTDGTNIFYSGADNQNDSFTYTVSDGISTATGTVNITAVAAPPAPATASQIVTDGNNVPTITFAGIPGRTNVVEASTNLINWTPISTNVAATNGLWQVIDSDATNYLNRFYRSYQPYP